MNHSNQDLTEANSISIMEEWVSCLKLNRTELCNITMCDSENISTLYAQTICEHKNVSMSNAPSFTLSVYHLVFLVLMAAVMTPANLLAIVALMREKKSKSGSGFKIYAVSLAFTDLFVGLFCIPLIIFEQTQDVYVGDIICALFNILDYGFGTVSIFLITAMGFDRFKCVSSPLSYRSDFRVRRVVLQCIVLWIFGIAVWIPAFLTLLFHQLSAIETEYCRFKHGAYSLIEAVIVYYLPLTATVIVYIKLVLHLRQRFQSSVLRDAAKPGGSSVQTECCHGYQSELDTANANRKKYVTTDNSILTNNVIYHSKKISHATSSATPSLKPTGFVQTHISSQNRQCAKTCLLIVIVFIVCWGPYCVLWPIYQSCPGCLNKDIYGVFAFMPYANSAINPFIYIFSSPRMRSVIKTRWLKLCGKNST